MGLHLQEENEEHMGLVRRSVVRSPSSERKSLKDEFVRLEADCKHLLQTAFNVSYFDTVNGV